MTEPRTPGDPGQDPTVEPTAVEPAAAESADDATQAWPSLMPSSESAPSAASWKIPPDAAPAVPAGSADAAPVEPAAAEPVPAEPGQATSPYEPADSLPPYRVETVADTGTFGAGPTAVAVLPASRSRIGLRWGLAILGILIVLAATAVIVYLAGARPATSVGVGYMPPAVAQYTEIRLDLPGDQRQKLAAFLANFPGFKDQSQIEPKLNDVFDRIVRAASDGKQTYTADIAPWFAGQISMGSGLPDLPPRPMSSGAFGTGLPGADKVLFVIGVKDRARAETWLTSVIPSATKDSYNGTDIWTSGTGLTATAVALNDKVMLAGTVEGVHAAIDSKGQGTLADAADFKAALAQVDRDYVLLSVIRTRPYIDAVTKMAEFASPGVLAGTQLDETITSMVPAWQASLARFENDALISSSIYPSLSIGYDATNHKSTLTGHVPATSILYAESHDVGPALGAVLAKFRALPEAKAAFQAFDQAVGILGGFDAAFGWWGDTAFAVAPGADGTIGGGLIIKPRDKAAADRFFTTIRGFLSLAGSSSGLNVRDEDYNGAKITILDFSAVPGTNTAGLPPGYKPEVAYAVTNDVAVLGYGRNFVASVIDAGSGANLAGDDRFKKLIARVGEENLGLSFLDINAIRGLIEPIIQQTAPEAWTAYQTDVKPYLEHVDALISAIRKDGGVDRGSAAFTAR